MHVQQHSSNSLYGRDELGDLCDQLRRDRIQFIRVFDEVLKFIVNLVSTVDGVKYGSEREADGNVVAVRLPVEVIADRPKEVVEIRNVIPQLVRDFRQFMCGLG